MKVFVAMSAGVGPRAEVIGARAGEAVLEEVLHAAGSMSPTVSSPPRRGYGGAAATLEATDAVAASWTGRRTRALSSRRSARAPRPGRSTKSTVACCSTGTSAVRQSAYRDERLGPRAESTDGIRTVSASSSSWYATSALQPGSPRASRRGSTVMSPCCARAARPRRRRPARGCRRQPSRSWSSTSNSDADEVAPGQVAAAPSERHAAGSRRR